MMPNRFRDAMSLLLLVLLFASCAGPGRPVGSTEGLIPLPQLVESREGMFACDGSLTVDWPEGWEAERAVVEAWFERAGLALSEASGGTADLVFEQDAIIEEAEGYRIEVDASSVKIYAGTPTGWFRGWTTVRKMMPVECETGCAEGFALPGVLIEDAPVLEHRGLLLDGCRHFQDVDFVKKQIETLALHGMNVLHWHLTEDQGWRIEIESRPRLTEVGAWRTEADGSRHGGFYTQEDIREVVAYATAHHIEVIPEIEMPGHSSAAIAAYPELGCTGDTLEVPHRWGVFKDIYCAGKEETFVFLEEVLDEVVELFPGPRIHIGGDEAPKVRWEECPLCQARMKEEGLANEEELQRWFIGRMGRYLATKGKTIIGWDEILEGGLPEGAAVQSWRGMEGAAEGVHLGADVVVSPTSHCYLDYPLRSTDLEEAYGFNPLPDSLTHGPGRILGGEGNMWTEHAPQERVESKVYPRLTALAEVYWSGPDRTTAEGAYGRFLDRLDRFYPRLDAIGVDYGLETTPFAVETRASADRGLEVLIQSKGRGVEGRGQWNRTGPTLSADEPFTVEGRGTVEMEVGQRGLWTGQFESVALDGHGAVFRPIELGYEYSPWYTGGGNQALVDGRLGSEDFRDGAWQAKQGQDMVATVDLGSPKAITGLSTAVYLYQDAWIFEPVSILWEGSTDGQSWFTMAERGPSAVLKQDDRQLRLDVDAEMDVPGQEARFVRMTAVNAGACPDWHAAAGAESWLFLDEMVVRTAD
ncbi:MAG: family 20 glycosylhydrolase [Flavobacteriales bacterium]